VTTPDTAIRDANFAVLLDMLPWLTKRRRVTRKFAPEVPDSQVNYPRFPFSRQGVWAHSAPGRGHYAPHTGHWPGPLRVYKIPARSICSEADAAAGSPLPPTEAHVAYVNWNMPRN
jgi:hypothetical protein